MASVCRWTTASLGRAPAMAAGLALVVSLVPVAGVVAAATHHELAPTAAGSWVAGVARTFTVTAHNEDHSVDTSYQGTIHISSTDPQAVLPHDYTFTAADAARGRSPAFRASCSLNP